MSEPGFREIQLNTKQVVFLLIAGVAAAVGIFLLGVSAGKGVSQNRPGEVVQNPDPAADITNAAGVMPPATSPKPDELKYHDDLQKKTPPTPADAPPDAAAKPAPAAKPTPTPTATPSPKPAAKPAPTPPAASKPTAPAAGGYYVQVNSFGSRENANRQVAQLKARGYTAYIFEATGPGAKYKVRMGPYGDASAANAMRDRLKKEGFDPSVSR